MSRATDSSSANISLAPAGSGARLEGGGPDLAARDRRTLELRQFFRLPRVADTHHSYETRIWFYFPRGFGIAPTTWGHDAFYRDVNVYMRIHAPRLKLSELADLEHPTNPASVLRRAVSLGLLAGRLPREIEGAIDSDALLEPADPTGKTLRTGPVKGTI